MNELGHFYIEQADVDVKDFITRYQEIIMKRMCEKTDGEFIVALAGDGFLTWREIELEAKHLDNQAANELEAQFNGSS